MSYDFMGDCFFAGIAGKRFWVGDIFVVNVGTYIWLRKVNAAVRTVDT
jgi:hypothetical protein